MIFEWNQKGTQLSFLQFIDEYDCTVKYQEINSNWLQILPRSYILVPLT